MKYRYWYTVYVEGPEELTPPPMEVLFARSHEVLSSTDTKNLIAPFHVLSSHAIKIDKLRERRDEYLDGIMKRLEE